MCQLFALSGNAPAAVTFSFTGLAQRGGRTDEHADGFGLAFHDGPVCRHFIDEAAACDSDLATFLRGHPIRARTVLAHIRKATQGAVSWANCHPFVREWQGRHWSFCHNGDLKGFKPDLDGSYLPVGDTDSEWAFCWILQELRREFGARRGAARWETLAPALESLARRIRPSGTFNFLLSDGEAVYAHCSTRLHWLRRQHPFPVAHLVDQDWRMDLSLDNRPDEHMVVLATAPLTSNEAWQAFGPGEMQVFVQGQSVWRREGTGPVSGDASRSFGDNRAPSLLQARSALGLAAA